MSVYLRWNFGGLLGSFSDGVCGFVDLFVYWSFIIGCESRNYWYDENDLGCCVDILCVLLFGGV